MSSVSAQVNGSLRDILCRSDSTGKLEGKGTPLLSQLVLTLHMVELVAHSLVLASSHEKSFGSRVCVCVCVSVCVCVCVRVRARACVGEGDGQSERERESERERVRVTEREREREREGERSAAISIILSSNQPLCLQQERALSF